MSERRRPDPFERPRWWEAWPHTRLYPALGVLLGLASPVGAFLLRFALARPLLKVLWVRSELSYNGLFYAYMGLGSVASFAFFGYMLGLWSERQRVRNKELRLRVEELHIKSVTDGLTGAVSHAYSRELLALELERARTMRRPLSVLMIDLDDFKSINDARGHLFGDRTLLEVSETIHMNIRQEDILGRYGGEEFVVLMPGADALMAERVAERICKAVARARIGDWSKKTGEAVSVTVSIGVATRLGSGPEDAVALLNEADLNLYRSKAAGKNRVTSARSSGGRSGENRKPDNAPGAG